MHALKRAGLLEYLGKNQIVLTDKGIEKLNFIEIEKLKLSTRKKDGLWRVIIFDIPEIKKHARKILRGKLIEFNSYQLQKSVYVTPYVCEKEINEILKLLDISKYVQILLAKSLGSSESLVRKYFARL